MVVWRICSTSRISAMSSLACARTSSMTRIPTCASPPDQYQCICHRTMNMALIMKHACRYTRTDRLWNLGYAPTTEPRRCRPARPFESPIQKAWRATRPRHRSTEPIPKRNRVCTDCMRRIRVPASGRKDHSPRFRVRRTDTAARSIRFYSNSRLQARTRLSRSRLHPAASHLTRSGQTHGRSAHRIARKFASRRGPSTVRKLSG
jgi:hypothetical protein